MVDLIRKDMDNDEEQHIDGIPSLSEDDLRELEEELVLSRQNSTLNRTRKSNYEVLNNILSEYLDSFIIIGYTSDGDEVVINKMSSPRDSRSIMSLLEEVAMSRLTDYGEEYEDGDE